MDFWWTDRRGGPWRELAKEADSPQIYLPVTPASISFQRAWSYPVSGQESTLSPCRPKSSQVVAQTIIDRLKGRNSSQCAAGWWHTDACHHCMDYLPCLGGRGGFLSRAIQRTNAGIEYKWFVLHHVILGEAAEEEICCAQD